MAIAATLRRNLGCARIGHSSLSLGLSYPGTAHVRPQQRIDAMVSSASSGAKAARGCYARGKSAAARPTTELRPLSAARMPRLMRAASLGLVAEAQMLFAAADCPAGAAAAGAASMATTVPAIAIPETSRGANPRHLLDTMCVSPVFPVLSP